MPILLRYKREHPNRVPSFGVGSQQRFPEEAFEVFRTIQQEESEVQEPPRRSGFGLLSLPRLRKQAARPAPPEEDEAASAAPGGEAEEKPPKRARGRKKAAARRPREAASGDGLTLSDVSEQLGIPYPTVARYASQFEDRIPHTGSGRNRRFPAEAVEVFRQIRKESKPGRPPKQKKEREVRAARVARTEPAARPARKERAAPAPAVSGASEAQLARRIESLERSQQILEDELRDLLDRISRPAVVTIHQV